MVGGVPMDVAVDSGSDITIIGKVMFTKVSSVAKLRNKDLNNLTTATYIQSSTIPCKRTY